ncbi:MAG: CspA family cold shock protein [Alphaproteobacteria bacterium]|nr:CspA family cold shock protein [Alphaproteobacteria bacterium]
MSNNEKKVQYLGVKCRVKWFNQFKGYGFVEIEGNPNDIFLHFSVLDQAGIKKLNNDDIIICDVESAERGLKVSKICEVVMLNKYEISDREPEQVKAVMKWFNPAKGFGFAQMSTGEDVFIHASLLKKNRLESIEHGQTLNLIVRYTNFGYEAIELLSADEK